MSHFVYILYSSNLDRYYIGSTSNLDDRLKKHNHIHKGFTASGQPWILEYKEVFECKTLALIREKQLKAWKNRERIMQLINQSKFISSVGSEHPDL